MDGLGRLKLYLVSSKRVLEKLPRLRVLVLDLVMSLRGDWSVAVREDGATFD